MATRQTARRFWASPGSPPESYDADQAETTLAAITQTQTITVTGLPTLKFDPKHDLIFDYDLKLPGHANGMMLMATDAQGDVTLRETYYSIGGGFVMTEEELTAGKDTDEGAPIPYPFKSAAEMLEMSKASGKSIAAMKRANEVTRNGEVKFRDGSKRLWQVMNDCINRGLNTDGILPGGLNVKRRAKGIHDALLAERGLNQSAPHTINGLDERLRHGRQRRERSRRASRHRPHQRCRRRDARDLALLSRPRPRCLRKPYRGLFAHRRCHRRSGQIQRLHLRR